MSMGTNNSMKLHHIARGFWDQHMHDLPSLSLGCKRFRLLAPKLSKNNNTVNVNSFDLKSFIKPENCPRNLVSSSHEKKDNLSSQQVSFRLPPPYILSNVDRVETHPGGTRWNPTQEQIGILEMLYKGGMRTPNAQQIEHITDQLAKYGKIEGKNVFYWFQNHKARERQKKKRNILGFTQTPIASSFDDSIILTLDTSVEIDEQQEISPCKRKNREWTFECAKDIYVKKNMSNKYECDQTLELFPLHPEDK